jgi:quercetin 2,3-dioxygenase
MKCFVLFSSILVLSISILLYNLPQVRDLLPDITLFTSVFKQRPSDLTSAESQPTNIATAKSSSISISSAESMNAVKNAMSKTLSHAKISPHRSGTRGHSDHGWLNTYHSFSFADWYHPDYTHFGSLRVLNEDRVKARSGFPTHPHRDFEIFSYVLSGELTHRDSMMQKAAADTAQSDQFYRMRRGDVQFTTGGTGIAHSEMNEGSKETVHFLQIWALPWRRGLAPRYHTRHFDEEAKRKAFVPILSPLKAGEDATAAEETAAEPALPDTIPIHADFVMGAGIIAPQEKFDWTVGAKATKTNNRKVFVHLPMTKGGKAKIRLDGRDDILNEGDGAFIEGARIGDTLVVESVGEAEAEVIVLDSDA